MQNLFQFLAYVIFGKYFIKWDMLQGYRMAMFVNEAEIEMNKAKMEDAKKRKEDLMSEMEKLELSPIADPIDFLPAEQLEDKKVVSNFIHKAKNERAEQIQTFKNKIKSAEQEVQLADGELAKIYSIAYSTRRKYDFMKGYKITKTYADLNK